MHPDQGHAEHPRSTRRLRTWAIVLNFNGAELTRSCVTYLRQCAGLDHILLVDNGSRENDRSRVFEAVASGPGVPTSLWQLETNYGYAGGMQAGIGVATQRGADLVYLVNNDCSVPQGAVSALSDMMCADPRLAACAGPVDHGDWVDGGSRLDHKRFRNVREPVRSYVYDVEFLPGDAWMLRISAIQEVGGLDCRLFLFGEEPDWCFRARRQGWVVRIVPAAAVSAMRGATTVHYGPEIAYYAVRNRVWLVRRQLTGTRKGTALALFFCLWLPRAVLHFISKRDRRGLTFALKAGVVGALGDCRWSDDVDEALANRVGRLGSTDAVPEPR